MNLKHKIMIILASITASKHAVAAPLTTGFFGWLVAPNLGFDPATWIVGAIGGIVIRVKLPPTTRADSIVNGVISVMLAGLASPWLVKGFQSVTSFPSPSIYLVAFGLAVAWPWVVKVAWESGKKRIKKWGDS
jgi:hypothetical protein